MAFAAVAAGLAIASVAAGAVGAAEDAKAQKKAVKAKRDADIKVLKAETEATLESLFADSAAQRQLLQTESSARIEALAYEADTEGQNVEISRLMRRDALNRGLLDEFSFRRDAFQVQGQQRAQFGSTGVDINSGSAAWLQEELIVATDLDALAISQNAKREAFGFEVEAYGATRRKALAELEGKSTAKVTAENIRGIQEVTGIRAKGIRKTSLENEKAIRKVAESGIAGISPTRSGALSALGSGTSFATSWYLSQR